MSMMVAKKKSIGTLIMVALFICAGIYMYWGINDRKEHLNDKETAYVIGKIIDFERAGKVAPWFTYEFYVDGGELRQGKYYIADTLRLKNNTYLRQYIGRIYLVEYSKEKPLYNEMYIDKPIPDSLSNCVKCYWEEFPF